MYSIKQLLKQEPAAIVSVIIMWLTVLVVSGQITWSAETLQAINGAGVASMLLFWVRPATVTKDALSQFAQAQDHATLKGVEIGKMSARVRPLKVDPAPVDPVEEPKVD